MNILVLTETPITSAIRIDRMSAMAVYVIAVLTLKAKLPLATAFVLMK